MLSVLYLALAIERRAMSLNAAASGVTFYVSGAVTKIVSFVETLAIWSAGKTWCTNVGAKWYMPSPDELKLIYNNKAKLNSTLSSIGATKLSSGSYWSSTGYTSNSAYGISFSNGNVDYLIRDNSYHVRAVCAL